MSTPISSLIETARYLGVHELVQPIDVLEVAKNIAQHPDARANFNAITALVQNAENYYARWAGIRAINVMGPAAIHRAAPLLRKQLAVEDFDLALRELQNALAKID